MDVGLQVEWVLDEINHGSRGGTADRVQEGSGRTGTPKAVLVQTEPVFSSFQKVFSIVYVDVDYSHKKTPKAPKHPLNICL